jgi:hypothetical protein
MVFFLFYCFIAYFAEMDNDGEIMVQQLMEEEAEAKAESKKWLLLILSLLHIRARLQPLRIGGSTKGKSKNIDGHRKAGALMLKDDYFRGKPTHGPKTFWRCFWMNKELFMKIVFAVREHDDYLKLKRDFTGLDGLTYVQK